MNNLELKNKLLIYYSKEQLVNIIIQAIEYIGLNEEDLKLYDIYDVNGIELYKILRGEDNENK